MRERKVKHRYGTRPSNSGKSYAEIAEICGYSTPSGARYQFYNGLRKILNVFLEYNDLTNLTKKQKEAILRSTEFQNFVRDAMIEKDKYENE